MGAPDSQAEGMEGREGQKSVQGGKGGECIGQSGGEEFLPCRHQLSAPRYGQRLITTYISETCLNRGD